jgi:uncharacterized protein YrrD
VDTTRTAKQIDIGADVIGRDGKKLGTVAYVVVQPPEMHITDIVVRTSAVLGREVVVPVNLIQDVENGKVSLTIDKNTLQKYPDYIEIHYQKPPPGWNPPEDRYYWLALPANSEGIRINVPPGTRGIREGMAVAALDGHKVGAVDGLIVDPAAKQITGFVVKHGILFAHDTQIPVADVEKILGSTVILKLTKAQVEHIERAQHQGKA